MTARRKLVRIDGRTYLERWGIEHHRIGGIFIHKMTAPDPGNDPHDHPWWFGSLILTGSYVEARTSLRTSGSRYNKRRQFSWQTMRTDEFHRIVHIVDGKCWTLVVHGPTVRDWGYKIARGGGWISHRHYGQSRRELQDVR
jgi:hypothetical protein